MTSASSLSATTSSTDSGPAARTMNWLPKQAAVIKAVKDIQCPPDGAGILLVMPPASDTTKTTTPTQGAGVTTCLVGAAIAAGWKETVVVTSTKRRQTHWIKRIVEQEGPLLSKTEDTVRTKERKWLVIAATAGDGNNVRGLGAGSSGMIIDYEVRLSAPLLMALQPMAFKPVPIVCRIAPDAAPPPEVMATILAPDGDRAIVCYE